MYIFCTCGYRASADGDLNPDGALVIGGASEPLLAGVHQVQGQLSYLLHRVVHLIRSKYPYFVTISAVSNLSLEGEHF